MKIVVDPSTVLPLPGTLVELRALVTSTAASGPTTERGKINKWLTWALQILDEGV